MGGNSVVLDKNNSLVNAQKIPLKEIGRDNFIKVFVDLFKKLDEMFFEKYNKHIWKTELLDSAILFNGSTSFIFDKSFSNDEIEELKSKVGDIDIIIPLNIKSYFWEFLNALKGKKINKNVTFIGHNKTKFSMIDDQINSIFEIKFNSETCKSQIDFEFGHFNNNLPTEWTKFGHCSSIIDARKKIKALHHKILLRCIFNGDYLKDEYLIATSDSTLENIKISKQHSDVEPTFIKFSIVNGLKFAYKPMLDKNGQQVEKNGLKVYKETDNPSYISDVFTIFKLAFPNANESEIAKFWSFIGLIELIKKYFNNEKIKAIHKRYVNKLWGISPRGVETEKINPDLDRQTKEIGYNYFIKELKQDDLSINLKDKFYKDYDKDNPLLDESFKGFLKFKNI